MSFFFLSLTPGRVRNARDINRKEIKRACTGLTLSWPEPRLVVVTVPGLLSWWIFRCFICVWLCVGLGVNTECFVLFCSVCFIIIYFVFSFFFVCLDFISYLFMYLSNYLFTFLLIIYISFTHIIKRNVVLYKIHISFISMKNICSLNRSIFPLRIS